MISELLCRNFITKSSTPSFCEAQLRLYFDIDFQKDNHDLCQYEFLTDENGELIECEILRTESLKSDMVRLGFDDFDAHVNSTLGLPDYTPFLSPGAIEFINERFAKDFELFGYEMLPV